MNTNKQDFINTKDRKILPSSSTLKIETAPSSIACSTLCCVLGSCCYASYDKTTRQCILEESCCPQNETSGDALMMKKSTGSLQCQNGWFKNENNCYFFSNDERNWNDTKSTCEGYGAMLVEVISSCELDFVKTKATGYASSLWLGGTDIEKEGDWIWSTSQTDLTFAEWGVGEPSNSNGNEHCLQMNAYWLGGTDIENEGDWMWSTSQTDITFADWGDGQPSNSDGNEYGLTWNDDPMYLQKAFYL
ncbi:natural killer cells antigen CD94-like [Mytilus trossulus]|uniref:natural killer cells antigen CD94-like n=1 Tax=Mytilus trossulus TaxID=6551 RepID=UPI003004B0AF